MLVGRFEFSNCQSVLCHPVTSPVVKPCPCMRLCNTDQSATKILAALVLAVDFISGYQWFYHDVFMLVEDVVNIIIRIGQ